LRLAVIFKIDPDYIRISLRSQDDAINASALAQELGGGGHFYAAGAKVSLKVNDDAIQKIHEIMQKIQESLRD
jgi:nanoRNase/pAp phosphatase (c-di-AMP/oligoRNAs hydrolase)